jgi:hypothetical protein
VDPCPILEKHGGAWKFDENKLGQTQEMGTRFATGLRQFPALTWHDDALIAMNNRDQLDVFWPDKFTAKDNAERPAEPLYRAVQGSNRLAVLLLRLRSEDVPINPDTAATAGKARCAQFTNRRGLPGPLGAGRHHATAGTSSRKISRRRVHRLPRIVNARRCRRTGTTSRSSRSRAANRRATSKSSRKGSPARSADEPQ